MNAMPSDRLTIVYATDEDIAVRASDDYTALCPPSQRLASGADGVFDAADPWTLTSPSVDFAAAGVAGQNIVRLTKPITQYKGGGELLAVDRVTGHSLTLRRYGMAAGVGSPPAPPGGLTGVEFAIVTFAPQIESKSFDLNERFGIDPRQPYRGPGDLYRLRDLRDLVVLEVLCERYEMLSRTTDTTYSTKTIEAELEELLSRRVVRWGPTGDTRPATGHFSTRLAR
jgi:hypothetical protein